MIPSNIQKEHLLSAIQEIDRKGIPSYQQYTRYDLIFEGKVYPPKLVVRWANRLVNGRELEDFSGGTETNNFLKQHGFVIREKKSAAISLDEEITLDYSEWVLQRLLEHHRTHPDFYFLTRTNRKRARLEAGHWFPGRNYLHVAITKGEAGDNSTKSVGFKVDCWGGPARAMLIILFKEEPDAAIRAFYRDLFETVKSKDFEDTGLNRAEELNHDFFVIHYGTDIPEALHVFLNRDVPIFNALLKKHGLEDKLAIPFKSFRGKLDNVLSIRGETLSVTYPNEKRFARLCWNRNGWVVPSGRYGKSKDPNAHEREYGFGYEEWLLDFDKLIDGYHYGFLQPVFQDWNAYKGKKYDVILFSRNAKEDQRYWIGEIQNVEVIDEEKCREILRIYQKNGWLKNMEDQMVAQGLNASDLGKYSSDNFFNVRFKPADYKPLADLQPFTQVNEEQIRSNRYKFFKAENISLPEEEKGGFNFRANAPNQTGERTITRTFEPRSIELPDQHKKIIDKLHAFLKSKYGAENVGGELSTGYGASRIDMVVKEGNNMTFYEVKTYHSLRECVRVAIGQLLEYCFWPDDERAVRLVIVTPHPVCAKTQKYFHRLRIRTGLELYCAQMDERTDTLIIWD
ncbi:MAG: excisionase family protein [Bacteroidetes bacterium]|nr:excisionase family protein [Bacteroidota bacterium]